MRQPGEPISVSHTTNYWEANEMVEALLEAGFRVDVISYRNSTFVPTEP